MGLRNRQLFTDKQCFFVTTTCSQHLPVLDSPSRKQLIADSLNFVAAKYAISILGYVIMPNHLHLLLFFQKENKLSDALRDFKKFTATQLRKSIETEGNFKLLEKLRATDGKQVFRIWQERFDDVWIGNKKLLETKLAYIHTNPLQEHWELVNSPEEYIFSSASFYEGQPENLVVLTDYREFF